MLRTLTALALFGTTIATVSKSTYAMSHPFAFKAFLEKYLPTAENLVQENSRSESHADTNLPRHDQERRMH